MFVLCLPVKIHAQKKAEIFGRFRGWDDFWAVWVFVAQGEVLVVYFQMAKDLTNIFNVCGVIRGMQYGGGFAFAVIKGDAHPIGI